MYLDPNLDKLVQQGMAYSLGCMIYVYTYTYIVIIQLINHVLAFASGLGTHITTY